MIVGVRIETALPLAQEDRDRLRRKAGELGADTVRVDADGNVALLVVRGRRNGPERPFVRFRLADPRWRTSVCQ